MSCVLTQPTQGGNTLMKKARCKIESLDYLLCKQKKYVCIYEYVHIHFVCSHTYMCVYERIKTYLREHTEEAGWLQRKDTE